jgi:hypothetical protein
MKSLLKQVRMSAEEVAMLVGVGLHMFYFSFPLRIKPLDLFLLQSV